MTSTTWTTAVIPGMNLKSTTPTLCLSFKIHVPNQPKLDDDKIHLPVPPSPILKTTSPTPIVPVAVTSTLINADDIIRREDRTLWSPRPEEQTGDISSPPPPPQTAPNTQILTDNEDTTDCPAPLPQDLDIIKFFIQHEKDNDYIPLMSSITLKKEKKCSSYPLNSTKTK